MKKKILLTAAVIILSSCTLFAQRKGNGKRLSFNRISVEIPENGYVVAKITNFAQMSPMNDILYN